MSKQQFTDMREQGFDVDDSGNIFNEQEHIQYPNPLAYDQKQIVFGCKINSLTKKEIEKTYGIKIEKT